jgi:hypothetical protein
MNAQPAAPPAWRSMVAITAGYVAATELTKAFFYRSATR